MQINNLVLRYGERTLFQDVNMNCLAEHRYAIVGANGAGKTTFLKIISGSIKPCDGEIAIAKHEKVGFLKQDQHLYDAYRIIDVVIAGNQRLYQAMHDKETLLAKEHLSDAELLAIADCETIIAEENGYGAAADAATLLSGLGIREHIHEQPLKTLSGGFKIRVLLAQLLFQSPSIMLLDEPTNHLDIDTIAWLEAYLRDNHRGILIFISHDRAFLSNLATDILDIDYQTIIHYPGNYDRHLITKSENQLLREKTRANQDKQLQHLQRYVDRFGAKASKAKQAQSKRKQMERISLEEVPLSTRMAPAFAFNVQKASGKLVLSCRDLFKSYGEKHVLHAVDFEVHRGDKIALIGANGLGKSTLLKILTEHTEADSGEASWGASVTCAYFAQDHHAMLKENCTALSWLENHASQATSQAVRNMLGQVLFSGDDVLKSVLSLSGGEAARLLLANMMLQKANCLLIDEPTNHLDMESVEALAKSLRQTEATMIVVSHDRYFLQQFATRVICLKPHGLEDYKGSIQEYVTMSQNTAVESDNVPQAKKKRKTQSPQLVANTSDKRQIQVLEDEIARLEQAIAKIDEQLAVPDAYLNGKDTDFQSLCQERETLQQTLQANYASWEALLDENN